MLLYFEIFDSLINSLNLREFTNYYIINTTLTLQSNISKYNNEILKNSNHLERKELSIAGEKLRASESILNFSIVDTEQCSKQYSGFGKLPNGIDDSMICAIDTNRTRAADACQGDSGGPLLMLTENGDSVIGITAFGQTCGSATPGVYTAVYTYLDWIEEHVWPNNEEEVLTKVGTINITITF